MQSRHAMIRMFYSKINLSRSRVGPASCLNYELKQTIFFALQSNITLNFEDVVAGQRSTKDVRCRGTTGNRMGATGNFPRFHSTSKPM